MRKENRSYYFSVEGETEQWYLEWLQKEINSTKTSKYKVVFNSKIEKNPISRVKGITVVDKIVITHIFDYESAKTEHVIGFKRTLDNMKKAQVIGKKVKYQLGYSNFSFELWIVLHKIDCNGSLMSLGSYLEHMNRGYGERFKGLGESKKEKHFKRLLQNLSIDDVISAIRRSKVIMNTNNNNGYRLQEHKGYKYYNENPSLSIWEVIEKILSDCELLNVTGTLKF